MARHGENIYKRKDGRYEGRYVIGKTITGKTRFGYVYGRQYAAVKKELLLKKADHARTVPAANGICQSTVGEWMAHWLENELRGSVKPSSYQTYVNLMNRHLIPILGSARLSAVSPAVVNDFVGHAQ